MLHRDLIVTLAARHKLPAVYHDRYFVAAGGLISYGPDYARNIPAGGRLRRSHPQGREAGRSAGAAPTKYELVINLKTAKALGLDVPPTAARPRRRGDRMRRREFIALLGGAAVAWPLAAGAQQPALPVIGFMSGRAPEDSSYLVDAFRQGLIQSGFVEGRNVAVEFRWAHGDYDRLPALAAELVGRNVAVLVGVGGDNSAVAAKRATSTIPIVFGMGGDPIKAGLVESLNRPGGNATGFTLLTNQLEPKRVGLMHELVPTASLLGALLNPGFLPAADQLRDVEEAARAVNLRTLRGESQQ